MRKYYLLLSVIFIFLTCLGIPNRKRLDVTFRARKHGNWCWAACAQMVMEYLGKNVRQCEQVNKRYNWNDCCNDPMPARCNATGWPEFDEFGFLYKINPLTLYILRR